MITIISATNRKDSNTLKVANEYGRLLSSRNIEHKLFTLENLPKSLLDTHIYDEDDETFLKLQEEYFFQADKFIFIIPEYNGSVPGVLKLLMDAADIKKAFYFKKALLVGVATGRAGNLRGMEHLTGILLHLKMDVHWNRLPISKIDIELNEDDHFFNESTLRTVNNQINQFVEWN
ncbi:MAG: NADPH-dependent FMN reductase [Chitinophagales bacterium]